MRRALGVLASAIVGVVVTAGTALADYPPSPQPTHAVSGSGGGGDGVGGTAFTGGSVVVAMIVVGVLAALGVTALLLARRRSVQEA
jgi:hypothetical protein